MKLLSDNNKITKGEKFGFYTLGVHLSPFDKSGFNVCPWASKGCALACLDTAGMGAFSNVQESRIKKTQFYHLTFSRSESNDEHCKIILALGGNVACVFSDELPKTWQGKRVVNGDESDLRFRDPSGCVVGLSTKGKAKADKTGFVIHN